MSDFTKGPVEIEKSGGHELTGADAEIAAATDSEPYALATHRVVSTSRPTGAHKKNPRTGEWDVPVYEEIVEVVFDPRYGNADRRAADAELIAAAFNAATRAEEWGYDGLRAVEALPDLLRTLELHRFPEYAESALAALAQARKED